MSVSLKLFFFHTNNGQTNFYETLLYRGAQRFLVILNFHLPSGVKMTQKPIILPPTCQWRVVHLYYMSQGQVIVLQILHSYPRCFLTEYHLEINVLYIYITENYLIILFLYKFQTLKTKKYKIKLQILFMLVVKIKFVPPTLLFHCLN